jgi:hypothetical protein
MIRVLLADDQLLVTLKGVPDRWHLYAVTETP